MRMMFNRSYVARTGGTAADVLGFDDGLELCAFPLRWPQLELKLGCAKSTATRPSALAVIHHQKHGARTQLSQPGIRGISSCLNKD